MNSILVKKLSKTHDGARRTVVAKPIGVLGGVPLAGSKLLIRTSFGNSHSAYFLIVWEVINFSLQEEKQNIKSLEKTHFCLANTRARLESTSEHRVRTMLKSITFSSKSSPSWVKKLTHKHGSLVIFNFLVWYNFTSDYNENKQNLQRCQRIFEESAKQ